MTFEREPGLTSERAGRSPSRVRVGRAAEQAAVLRLQRLLGNRGTRALLRSPPGPRGEFPTLSDTATASGLDDSSWKQKVAAAKKALDDRKVDEATALYTELYQDLAKTAGADVVDDIPASFPVNRANKDDTGFKPGLNLVLGSGSDKGGTTAWVDASGKFRVPLSFTSGDPAPHIAVRLYSSSFTADKTMALDTLRHEMTHAVHLQKTLKQLRAWRLVDRTGDEGRFEKWLGAHRADLSDADVALVKAAAKGLKGSTEVLAYVEGFMAVFHLIDPAPPPVHLVYGELLGVLETSTVLPWASADSAVQTEAIRRLEQYYCEVLDFAHRRSFDEWVATQANQAQDEEAALKKASTPAAVRDANDHLALKRKDLVGRLQKIPAKCKARSTGADMPADTAARHAALLNAGKPGDEALVLAELRRLDPTTLAKVDDAAAKMPKNAGAALRRKISFARHRPDDAVPGIDDLTIKGGDTTVNGQAVDGGTVTVTSKSDLSWSQTFPRTGKQSQGLTNAVTFQYAGANARRAHWIQLISRQVTVINADGSKTVLDKETSNSAGISYRLTPAKSPPILAVDRVTRSEPWYEHGSPSHRDQGAIRIADVPDPHEGDFGHYIAEDSTAKGVLATAHLTTYLIRDDKVLFRADTDVTWNWTRNTKRQRSTDPPYTPTGPLYKPSGKPVQALDRRDRDALLHDFPDLDYLP